MILNLNINIFCKMFCLKIVFVITVFKNKWKWKWRDIRPSTVTHTQNLCSTFNPSKVHAHSSEHTHTHTPWTHTRRTGQPFMLWSPGSSWGCGALLKGTSVVVLRVERSVYIHPPQPTIPARPRLGLATFRLQVWLSNQQATTSLLLGLIFCYITLDIHTFLSVA